VIEYNEEMMKYKIEKVDGGKVQVKHVSRNVLAFRYRI
jgi:hypothetical protein